MKKLNTEKKVILFDGTVIPAHPLALYDDGQLDEDGQRLLTRYYMSAGAGGIAVGVHTTQFSIRDPKINLYKKVLELAAEEVTNSNLSRPFLKIAGVSGDIKATIKEAALAADLGYDMALLSVNGLGNWSNEELLERAREVSQILPVFGFYLQPAVGGKLLDYKFWKDFAEIPNVLAIKMAPFNRYQTLDVVRAVCESTRCEEIALYTGNDDNIVADLLTTYEFNVNGKMKSKAIVGGLLGHWAIWTKKAVKLLDEVKEVRKSGGQVPSALLTKGIAVTDSNAAFFDAANNFKGCIAGIHEVLRRQGLMKNIRCLDPKEGLSPGQMDEITRVYESYPDLNDDGFVRSFLN
ncbi:MAG: dihydrodipicolinate synthase family protein [Bacteroidetes bacterium]|nr:dihydrodipicolinate synthase family protein [Bacteroidota bacterium]MDA1121268.1 dihydrodipicolinate synthase family protein [Bacteroidota bacterium]